MAKTILEEIQDRQRKVVAAAEDLLKANSAVTADPLYRLGTRTGNFEAACRGAGRRQLAAFRKKVVKAKMIAATLVDITCNRQKP